MYYNGLVNSLKRCVMVGYVRIFKPELKIKEYEAYRGIYCTLCKTLGKEYGALSRLLLSYDLTFLALVLLSDNKKPLSFDGGRCPFNPTKKCNYCSCNNKIFSYAAAVTVLMFYYKVRDEIADSGLFKRLFAYMLLPYASLLQKKARKRYAELDNIIAGSMQKQSLCEKSNTADIDKAAHNSADALGKIFTYFEKNDRLYRFGYLVGRWVYLTDAADDLKKDIKNNSFNVFKNKYSLSDVSDINENIVKDIEETLNYCQGVIAEAYMSSDFGTLSAVIENVVFESFTNTALNVVKGINNNEKSL